jgi:hypothetical protein
LFVPAGNYIEKRTNDSSETRRYYDEAHFQAYIRKIAEVSLFYTITPTHCNPEIRSMVGVRGQHFFDELIANNLGLCKEKS